MNDDAALDNPIWAALTGPHASLAIRHGDAVRYPDDITRFAAIADAEDPAAWHDLAALTAGSTVAVFGISPDSVPGGWQRIDQLTAVQMVAPHEAPVTEQDAEAFLPLDGSDVDAMLRLVALTRPGPFLPRTIELGGYLGIRPGGPSTPLAAMGGQRLAPPGWREISAICTDPEYRGRGYARRIITELDRRTRARGERSFLHATADNPARGLYEAMGFTVRRPIDIVVLRSAT